LIIDDIRKIHYEQKGREEGAILARREDILENLNEIGTVNDDIIKRVNEESDIVTLRKWLKISIVSENLQEFIDKTKYYIVSYNEKMRE
jgi:hypothetical protein